MAKTLQVRVILVDYLASLAATTHGGRLLQPAGHARSGEGGTWEGLASTILSVPSSFPFYARPSTYLAQPDEFLVGVAVGGCVPAERIQ